jgi:spore coat protein CotH
LVGLTATGLVLGLFGSFPLKPYAVAPPTADDGISQDLAGTVALFDATVTHQIELSVEATDLDLLLDDYFNDQDKTWIPADLTIDGTWVSDVGLRLKGNSTLRMLQDDRDGAQTGSGTGPLGTGGESSLSANQPETLPWLISFDHYVEGRAYQGLTELAVRPAAGFANTYETLLNEALALALTAQTGQPSQRSAYCLYSVNQGAAVTRLLVEAPDTGYASSALGGDGALYKVLSTGQFAYQGQDQTEYDDDFKQVSATGVWDLQPVIEFLDWLESASDEEFAAELDDWFDVDGLVSYLATQSVLGNSDALDGPGRNGYLWYDAGDGRLSVVVWDLNLAFSGRGGLGGGGGWGVPGTTRGGTEPATDPAGAEGETPAASPSPTAAAPPDQASPSGQSTEPGQTAPSTDPAGSSPPSGPTGTTGQTGQTGADRGGFPGTAGQRPGGWGGGMPNGAGPGGTGQLDPSQFDPSQFDPGQFDPSQFDPGQFDPGQTDPSQTGTGQTETGQTDPGTGGTGQTRPGRVPTDQGAGPGQGGFMDQTNALISRFEADAGFAALIEARQTALIEQLFSSGVADRLLTELAAQIPLGANLDAEQIASETDSLRQTLAAWTT